MIDFIYEERNCDICGANNHEVLLQYTTKVRTYKDIYNWEVSSVICKECGFVFVSPCPNNNSLINYYQNTYEYWSGQMLDYSIDKRVDVINRIETKGTHTFVELGGNAQPTFKDELLTIFDNYINVEINSFANSDAVSLSELQSLFVDIVGAYFVFEHLPNPKAIFLECYRVLNDEGFLIIEVPDLYKYDVHAAGITCFEHLNHFSPQSLSKMAELCGFRTLLMSYADCSREFGFVAVFKKNYSGSLDIDENSIDCTLNKTEYLYGKSCFLSGVKLNNQIQIYHDTCIKRIIDTIQSGGGVVIWAANKLTFDLVQSFSLPDETIVVDSNPKKRDYLLPFKVYQPIEVVQKIKKAKLIIINTPANRDDIIEWLNNNAGINIDNVEMIVAQ